MTNTKLGEYPLRLDFMILLLAITGGSTDAIVYLRFHLMVAAQTGNTALLAVAAAEGHFEAALGSLVSVVGYIIGISAGELALDRRGDIQPWSSTIGTIVIAELIMLVCLFIFWHLTGAGQVPPIGNLLVACASIAMGLQSDAMLPLGDGPKTTYITGTLAAFATRLVAWLHLVERAKVRERRDVRFIHRLSAIDAPWIHALTWIAYLLGATVAGILFFYERGVVLLLPVIAVLIVIIVMRVDSSSAARSPCGAGAADIAKALS